jgi:hypothetical protein
MEPEILVKTENLYYNLGEVFYSVEKIKSIVEDNGSVNILWFPYNSLSTGDYNPKNDDLWVRLTNKAPPDVDCEDWDFYTWRDTKDYITQSSLSSIFALLAEEQSLVPYYSWTAFKCLKYVLYPSGEIYQEHPHAVHFRLKEAKPTLIFIHFYNYFKIIYIYIYIVSDIYIVDVCNGRILSLLALPVYSCFHISNLFFPQNITLELH